MAYQKLQGYRALPVIPSDTIDIPNISSPKAQGTSTSVAGSELRDSGATFTTRVKKGDIVYNTDTSTIATVVSVDSDTQLTISANIFTVPAGEAYTIYADDNPGCVLYFGGAGNVKVLTTGNDTVTFTGVLGGTFFPVQVKRVYSGGTTVSANTILALW